LALNQKQLSVLWQLPSYLSKQQQLSHWSRWLQKKPIDWQYCWT
jgi:hypothetical protein